MFIYKRVQFYPRSVWKIISLFILFEKNWSKSSIFTKVLEKKQPERTDAQEIPQRELLPVFKIIPDF